MAEEIKEIIEFLNPWWKNDKISEELAKPFHRKVFEKISEFISYRQVVILTGLRRVGKTTILYQLLNKFLKDKNPKNLLYYNFDKKTEDLSKILDTYNELTGINWKVDKINVFLDEVSKLENWASQIKLIYDSFPNIKFFLSSSSSTNLEEEAIKNLAGRYFIVNIFPLNFEEYLELRRKSNYFKNITLYEKEIKKEYQLYLLRSFPEIINWEDELMIKDYLRSTIIDKIIKSDIPEKFKNINKDLLTTLMEMFYTNPGIYLDYDHISKNLNISKKTLIRHIFYLEFSYLIRKVKNFRPSTFATIRKMQRVYPYWWSLAYCYGNNNDKITENLVASIIDAKYYWRKDGKEIDFLNINDKKIIPYEVKNKIDLTGNDLTSLKYFIKKFKINECFLLYNGKEDEIKVEKSVIKLIPIWKWLLSQSGESEIK